MKPLGVTIAVHNGWKRTRKCLQYLQESNGCKPHIIVIDDGSNDGTSDFISKEFQEVVLIKGDGNLWWAGANNIGIRKCLELQCEYIVLLNPDVYIAPSTLTELTAAANSNPDSILAPVVINSQMPQNIWWAGSKWQPVFGPCVWASRYLYKSGERADQLPATPFLTSEAHGRCVLYPAKLFNEAGLFDAKNFPQYGGDTEFSFRAQRYGYKIWVFPSIRVLLDTSNTNLGTTLQNEPLIRRIFKYLTSVKNGNALAVWWHITYRHLPFYAVIPSYLFIISLNIYRIIMSSFSKRVKG